VAVIPSTSPNPNDEDACRTAAAQLQHEHQHWLVLWGCYTRTYIAFPLFAAPSGTILTAAAPAELAVKMRRQERSAGVRVPPPSPPPEWQDTQDWQNARDAQSGQSRPGWQDTQDWQSAEHRPGRHSLGRPR
jgi:hypothetical protein